jgi:ABC-type multidrug transport system fused ATPase/permease subunit
MKKIDRFTEFIQAIKQSFDLTKKIIPNLVWFDLVKTIWNSCSTFFASGITSLGIIMITRLNKNEDMFLWVLIFIASTTFFMVVNQIFSEFETVYTALKNEKLFQEQKAFFAEKIDTLDPARLFSPNFSKIKNKFENKGWKAMTGMYDKIFILIGGIITFTVSLGIAAWLSPWVIILAIVPGIYSGVSIALANKKVLKIWDDGHHDRMMFLEYDSLVSHNWSILQTIFHGSRSYFKKRFGESRLDVQNNIVEIQNVRTKRRLWFVGINTVCTVIAIAIICLSAKNGKVTIVTWPIIYAAFYAIKNAVTILGFYSAGIYVDMTEYKRYFVPFSELDPLYPEGNKKIETLFPISFENVGFTYPTNEPEPSPAINNLSLTIQKGEMVGLIGHNGGGKTTLINMISGIYFPAQGNVSFSGTSIDQIKRSSLYDLILVESSHNGLPKTTVREIVSASLEQNQDEVIWEVLEVVGMKTFVEELPDRLETKIGEHWDKGRLISAGQIKRLSLGALYFKSLDPKIEMIIMDEPMANIDPETKTDLYNKITNGTLFPGKTVVVCLHDKEYEYLFPRIIKMTQGVMTEKKINLRTNSLSFSLFQEPEYQSN